MNAISLISLFGFIQVVLVCLGFSFSVKKWEQSKLLFVALQAILGLVFLRTLLAYSGALADHPEYIGWGLWVTLMAAPLAYFYMLSAFDHQYKMPENAWVHFIPAILGGVCTVLMFSEDPAVRKLMVETLIAKKGMLDRTDTYLFWVFHAERLLFVPQILFYWWISGRVQNLDQPSFDYTEKNRQFLKWIHTLRQAFLVFVLVRIIFMLIDAFITPVPNVLVAGSGQLILVYIVASTVLHSIKSIELNIAPNPPQTTVSLKSTISAGDESKKSLSGTLELEGYTPKIEPITEQETFQIDSGKYEKDKLCQQRLEKIAKRFEAVMRKEKYFIESDLTMSYVANHLDCSANHLSQAINTVYEKTFTNVVSQMRVEEAKSLLTSASEVSVLDICFMAGFKSKSSFYKSFKKHTNLTPAAYRQSPVPSLSDFLG